PGLQRVMTPLGTGRVACHTGSRSRLIGCPVVPVAAPLPDVSGHVVQPIAVQWIRSDGGCAEEPIRFRIATRKLSGPEIGPWTALLLRLGSPDVSCLRETAPGSVFPVRLGRKSLAGPLGVGGRVVPRNVHH